MRTWASRSPSPRAPSSATSSSRTPGRARSDSVRARPQVGRAGQAKELRLTATHCPAGTTPWSASTAATRSRSASATSVSSTSSRGVKRTPSPKRSTTARSPARTRSLPRSAMRPFSTLTPQNHCPSPWECHPRWSSAASSTTGSGSGSARPRRASTSAVNRASPQSCTRYFMRACSRSVRSPLSRWTSTMAWMTSSKSSGATVVSGSARRGKVPGLVWLLPIPPPTSTVKASTRSPTRRGTTPTSWV